MVDREYFLGKVDATLKMLRGEICKSKPWWCPSRIYLWWVIRKTKYIDK